MILRDYRCPAHGLFESFEDRCQQPGCQETVTPVFLKPVGITSVRTQGIDRELRAQAESFGMTDLRSAREGDNQLGYLPKTVPFQEQPPEAWREPPSIQWGTVANSRFSNPGLIGNDKQDIGTTVASPLRQFVNLSEKTQFSHVPPKPIKRTAEGLIE